MDIVVALLSLAVGAVSGWFIAQSRSAALAERARLATEQLAKTETELTALRARATELETERGALKEAQARLLESFKALSADALRSNNQSFLELARETFGKLHQQSADELGKRQQAIDSMVKPLKESLEKVDLKINELEQKRERAYGELGQQLASLNTAQQKMQSETTKLSSALSTTRTAGTWGEVQLRRVVELSGMMEHCDFAEQRVIPGEDGRTRPDLIVSLPGGQRIVVDAKAPTEAFREAAAEPDAELRLAKLKEHAAKIRGHIEDLASKEYWARIQPSPEYVVLFLPGDSFLSAAIESDPSIMDKAINRRVLLATPMTLIALLKAAAYGWRQEAVSQGAEEVSKLGRELYDRISVFAEHLGSTAKGLTAAVRNFNSAVGSFEQKILPGARKFAELGAKGIRELEDPERVEVEVRDVAKRG